MRHLPYLSFQCPWRRRRTLMTCTAVHLLPAAVVIPRSLRTVSAGLAPEHILHRPQAHQRGFNPSRPVKTDLPLGMAISLYTGDTNVV